MIGIEDGVTSGAGGDGEDAPMLRVFGGRMDEKKPLIFPELEVESGSDKAGASGDIVDSVVDVELGRGGEAVLPPCEPEVIGLDDESGEVGSLGGVGWVNEGPPPLGVSLQL
jgi:hypothetical protein